MKAALLATALVVFSFYVSSAEAAGLCAEAFESPSIEISNGRVIQSVTGRAKSSDGIRQVRLEALSSGDAPGSGQTLRYTDGDFVMELPLPKVLSLAPLRAAARDVDGARIKRVYLKRNDGSTVMVVMTASFDGEKLTLVRIEDDGRTRQLESKFVFHVHIIYADHISFDAIEVSQTDASSTESNETRRQYVELHSSIDLATQP